MKRYGYVRVSSKDQNIDRQLEALRELGIRDANIFIDKMSGKDFSRPSYKRMLKRLKKKDVVVILSIDRLGRNYDEILEQWRILTKEKQVDIEVIDMPLLNTTYERDGLTGVFIADLVLQILAYVAETERKFIRTRQAEGIAVAKKKGVRFGRPKKTYADSTDIIISDVFAGKIKKADAMRICGLSKSTFYRKLRECEKK